MSETTYLSESSTSPPPPPPASAAAPDAPAKGGGNGRSTVVSAVVAALVSVLVAVPIARDQAVDAAAPEVAAVDVAAEAPAAATEPIARVAERVSPSIAQVNVSGSRGQGSGSAVVYREDGYLLTNAHVVRGGTDIEVVLPDGNGHTAEIVGTDDVSDLAVLRIDASGLPVPSLAQSPPRVGDTAVALGSPFGLEGSVTAGIISATDRSLPGDGSPLVGLLQTDAPINPGNSGGALVNGQGELIGINTAILSQTRENNGIGFAIPIQTIAPLAEELISQGRVDHALLGIEGQSVDPQVAELYALGVERGAIVAIVLEDGPADRAGLQRGDIITAVDGEEVDSMAELAGRISSYRPDDEVDLTVVRGGDERTVDVTLGRSATDQQP